MSQESPERRTLNLRSPSIKISNDTRKSVNKQASLQNKSITNLLKKKSSQIKAKKTLQSIDSIISKHRFTNQNIDEFEYSGDYRLQDSNNTGH